MVKKHFINFKKSLILYNNKEVDNKYIPDPFTPCNHTEILHWEDRKLFFYDKNIDRL
jgi:hypothetical protein